MKRPAVLGGAPAFPHGLPFAKPHAPPIERVAARLAPSLERSVLTNGPLVREFEERAAEYLGVPHAVAVSSCTAGLILTWSALAESGPVVLPSFTFAASAHALVWSGLETRFAECSPDSFQLDVDDAEARVDGAVGVFATHVFGAPCLAGELESLGRRIGAPVVFDAAHAFGATHDGRPVATFGTASVFSLSPTKVIVAGEGGIVATADHGLARHLRVARNYGDAGDYDCRFVGLNARMSEFHAAVALESLAEIDNQLGLRAALARRYIEGLRDVPGIAVQAVAETDRSTYKDFSIAVDALAFGLTRDQVVIALHAEGIDTRQYFSPPVHRQQAYLRLKPSSLPITDDVSARVISLPMFGDLSWSAVDSVVAILRDLHDRAEEVRAAPAA